MSEAVRHKFEADVSELLKLVIHSLYTSKEIFLRELLSNSFDALEKLRFRAIAEPSLLAGQEKLEVRIVADAEAGTLTIEDTGVGMTQDELAKNLGTIAHSGSKAFFEKMKEAAANKEAGLTLIGQFGVGFYSSFLVADKVEVTSLAAGEREAFTWSSDAKESYTIEPARKVERGTRVVLHVREDQKKFLETWEIRNLVEQYSDYAQYPVMLETKKGEFERINRAEALWQRSPSDVTAAQYEELYKRLTHDFEAPLAQVHFKIEGTQEFSAVLFIPKKPPFELYARQERGLRLYVKRVFIMEESDALLPQWLRFVRGVVDSDDLPLNVSRELLQDSSIARTIKKQVTKKVLDRLEEMARDAKDDFATFIGAFGAVLKEGIATDAENRDRIAGLCRWKSTKEVSTSLAEYVARMPAEQKSIYYAIGDAGAEAPQLEAVKARGQEVLLMTDPVDEWAVDALGMFEEKPFASAMREDMEVEAVPDDVVEPLKPLLARMKSVLGERVADVGVTSRLVESPACLVLGKGAHHAPIERMLRAAGHKVPKAKKKLELNPKSSVVQKLRTLIESNDAAADRWIETLYDQAILAEGGMPDDPVRFARRITELLESK